jgi:hypothetical protein
LANTNIIGVSTIGAGQTLSIGQNGTSSWIVNPSLSTSIGNVTTGNLNSALNSALSGLRLNENAQISPNVKQYEVFEITEDLLALSTCWQRIRNDKTYTGARPTKITDEILFDKVNFEDKQKAEKVRDYYSKKFTLWALNGIRLSKFREDLKKFVHSDGKMFKEDMKPLVYRLPEFYDYDTEFDEMINNHNMTSTQTFRSMSTTKNLTFIKQLTKTKKRSVPIVTKEFWFTDDSQNLNCIPLNKDNPLLSLMEKQVKTPFSIDALSVKHIRDNREFFVLEKYSFL